MSSQLQLFLTLFALTIERPRRWDNRWMDGVFANAGSLSNGASGFGTSAIFRLIWWNRARRISIGRMVRKVGNLMDFRVNYRVRNNWNRNGSAIIWWNEFWGKKASALAKHSFEQNHQFDFEHVKILSSETYFNKRSIFESYISKKTTTPVKIRAIFKLYPTSITNDQLFFKIKYLQTEW